MFKYKIGLLRRVKQHLKNGGIIAYPTESCYGFGCDTLNYKALKQIIKIKGRSKSKGMICIASNYKHLNKLVKPFTADELSQIQQYWPGFYSLIIASSSKTPRLLVGNHNSIAARVSTHNEVRQLCNYLRDALVSTSANKSGRKSIKSYRECLRQFGKKAMVLPGIIGFYRKPSTIINLATKQKIR